MRIEAEDNPMSQVQLLDVIEVNNTLGEGVQWNAQDGCVWWTDIQECRLYRLHWASRSLECYPTPERLCSFGFVEGDESMLVAAFASGLALYDYKRQRIDWLARPEAGLTGVRFNDGRMDRQGRFWAGSMNESDSGEACASLYRLDPDGSVSPERGDILISNGICWSPDSRRFYFADSPRRTIYACDFDPQTGTFSGERVFAQTEEGIFPDGAIVDAEGYLWSAQWQGWRLVRYAANGRVDSMVKMPVSQPTCVAFGGDDFDLLFVTSARESLDAAALSAQPLAGSLFVYQAPVQGLPDGRFAAIKGA